VSGALSLPRLDAVVSGEAHEAPAWDETQSSAAVLRSRLVSAVGASVSDGACASGQHAAGPAA
jgi:hypothetical protein